jgi:hypothetical protein
LSLQQKERKGLYTKDSLIAQLQLKIGYLAFTHTVVDCFGPIDTTIFRSIVKRLGSLFSCFTLRCCHLEIDISSFISALDHFQNGRGVTAIFNSDNETQLVGSK